MKSLLASCLALTAVLPAPGADAPPNVLFILIDDLGARDLGGEGARLAESPHLDRLARQGLRFTAGYAPAPICSASRAAFLTGRSPARLHFEFVTKAAGAKAPAGTKLVQPAFPVNLPLEEITLAELLSPVGYVTGFLGKWHLTQENDRYLGHGSTFGPGQQGFAETSEERGSHPYNYPVPKRPPVRDVADGQYEPDALTDAAIAFLERHQRDRFFLQLAPYHVHEPVNTRGQWLIDKYTAKAKRLGLQATETQIRYAAFVEIMDHLVGRVLDALERLGLADRTLVIVTSDNGGAPPYTDNHPLRGTKWTLYEGGIREPFYVRWPGVVAPGGTCDTPVIGTDLFPTLAAVAGAELPADRSLDGINLAPLFRDPAARLNRDRLVWHFPFYLAEVGETPVSALRRGDLKLVHHYEDGRTELFDLRADPAEQHDLSRSRPEETAELRAELLRVLQEQGARFPTAS